MTTRLLGRFVDTVGAPLAGVLRMMPIRASGVDASAMTTMDLSAAGGFSADVADPTARGYMLIDPAGRQWSVDLSGRTPTVQADAAGTSRLELAYAGDPDLQDQTAQSLASSARTQAVAAQAAAHAMSATMAILSSTLQQTLLANAALSVRLSAVEARTVRVVSARATLPALAINVAKTVDVVWAVPAAATPQGVEVFVEPLGSLLGAVTASVVPGSVTATGCQVRVSSPALLGLGAGSVHVVGWLWT